jgi:hypothetical protein
MAATAAALAPTVALGPISAAGFRKELTGVLILPSVVLTASHASAATAVAFSHDLSNAGATRTIDILHWSPPAQSVWPPGAASVRIDAGLAYLREAAPEAFAPLANGSELHKAKTGVVAKFLDNGVKTLVEVMLAPCSESGCEVMTEIEAWALIDATALRTGDSGAPLFIDVGGTWKVAGVLSRGASTGARSKGAVFSRIMPMLAWLDGNASPV